MKPRLFVPHRDVLERQDPGDSSELVHTGLLGRIRNMPRLAKVLNAAIALGFAPNVIETAPLEVQMWTSERDHFDRRETLADETP